MSNNIALQLTCQRRALGLNISELADMLDIDKRVISFVERGERKPTRSYLESMRSLSTHYELLVTLLLRDISAFNIANPLPITDDSDEYFKLMKSVNRLTLPYFSDFDSFVAATGASSLSYWRLWQAAISHLVMIGAIAHVVDDAPMPDSFKQTRFWLDLGYDVIDLAEDE